MCVVEQHMEPFKAHDSLSSKMCLAVDCSVKEVHMGDIDKPATEQDDCFYRSEAYF